MNCEGPGDYSNRAQGAAWPTANLLFTYYSLYLPQQAQGYDVCVFTIQFTLCLVVIVCIQVRLVFLIICPPPISQSYGMEPKIKNLFIG